MQMYHDWKITRKMERNVGKSEFEVLRKEIIYKTGDWLLLSMLNLPEPKLEWKYDWKSIKFCS